MTLSTKEIGDKGEILALGRLKKMGYKIINRNLSTRYGEIDILAKHENTLVIVEVKSLIEESEFGSPVLRVGQKKMVKLHKMALMLMQKYNLVNTDFRFDVVIVDLSGRKPDIEVIKNAF